ncbi:Glycerophosphodiester phosphodiesterase [Pseudomonas fluorescens]|uniref:Glycerophosphodiester phosphodiesterase n=1 Tax=Pseudomonas fluorescens TaxID=294 RepID=A0A5E7U241_PSEFL|nr:Glycerophosphodiester phosphodiesterase [Pseudomonas fluorescens]
MPATFSKHALMLSLLLGLGQAQAASEPTPGALAARLGIPHPAVIAHRGASFDAPESTAAAYQLARDLGADYLELDLQRSKDGVLFALHDNNLQRTTDVASKFPERKDSPATAFTLAELKTLDAGSWFNTAYPDRARPSYAGLKTSPSMKSSTLPRATRCTSRACTSKPRSPSNFPASSTT